MQESFSLTVSESKRLIAKGIAADPVVRSAFNTGMVVVAPGTTNGYVVEELTGKAFDKKNYVTGRTLPSNFEGVVPAYKAKDAVFVKGEPVDLSISDAIAEMRSGDVFVKGANSLNYDLDQTGILIGHPTSGTIGSVIGTAVAKRVRLIHPVGLEKNIPGDLAATAQWLNHSSDGSGVTLFVSPGEIFTEIEAVETLSEVTAVPLAAGGVGGAEGAVWLSVYGDAEEVKALYSLIESIKGEMPFIG